MNTQTEDPWKYAREMGRIAVRLADMPSAPVNKPAKQEGKR